MSIKILFVCHGNICRSPMAEAVFMDMVRQKGLQGKVVADSAAVSPEELGNPIYPPVQRLLRENRIPFDRSHAAKVMTKKDYDRYDLLIGMDAGNLRRMETICGGDSMGKLHRLLEYTGSCRDVADPYYYGNYDATWRDVNEGCRALLAQLEENGLLR